MYQQNSCNISVPHLYKWLEVRKIQVHLSLSIPCSWFTIYPWILRNRKICTSPCICLSFSALHAGSHHRCPPPPPPPPRPPPPPPNPPRPPPRPPPPLPPRPCEFGPPGIAPPKLLQHNLRIEACSSPPPPPTLPNNTLIAILLQIHSVLNFPAP
jgi:hypothetical protein